MSGLLLALISIIFALVQAVFTMPVAVNSVISIVKLASTIGALFYFMKDYGRQAATYPYGKALKYGFTVSFCSAVISAVYFYFHFAFIFTEQSETLKLALLEGFNQAAGAAGTQVDFSSVVENLPVIVSFYILFYYTIIGLIIASIIASFLKRDRNPVI